MVAGVGNRRRMECTQGVYSFKDFVSVFLALVLRKREFPLQGDVSLAVFLSLLQKQECPLGGNVAVCPLGMYLGSDDDVADTRN